LVDIACAEDRFSNGAAACTASSVLESDCRVAWVLVTHDQSEALSLGQQIAVLRHRVVAQAAPPETLYREPIDPDLAQFVGEAVLLPGTVVDGFVSCALGRLPLCIPTRNGAADVLVRPEQIRVSSQTTVPSPFGKVLAVTYYGHDARVVASLESDTLQIATRVVGHGIPQVGSRVRLEVEGSVVAYPRMPPTVELEKVASPRSLVFADTAEARHTRSEPWARLVSCAPRLNAANPSPPNPTSSVAQVESSGVAAAYATPP
jgi:hypothetical protein